MTPSPRIRSGWPQGRASCQRNPLLSVHKVQSQKQIYSHDSDESHSSTTPPNLDLCHYSRPVVFQLHLLKSSTSLKRPVCKGTSSAMLVNAQADPETHFSNSLQPATSPKANGHDGRPFSFSLSIHRTFQTHDTHCLAYCPHRFTLITVQKQQLSHSNHTAGLSASMSFIERQEPTQKITSIFT